MNEFNIDAIECCASDSPSDEVFIIEEDEESNPLVFHRINSDDFKYSMEDELSPSSLSQLQHGRNFNHTGTGKAEMHSVTKRMKVTVSEKSPLFTIDNNINPQSNRYNFYTPKRCESEDLFCKPINKSEERNFSQNTSDSECNDIAVEVASFNTNTVEELPPNLNPRNHADYHIIDEQHPNIATDVVVCSTLQDIANIKQRKVELERSHYKFKCDTCQRHYSSALALKAHKVRHLSRSQLPFQCYAEGCTFACATKLEREKHVLRIHQRQSGLTEQKLYHRGRKAQQPKTTLPGDHHSTLGLVKQSEYGDGLGKEVCSGKSSENIREFQRQSHPSDQKTLMEAEAVVTQRLNFNHVQKQNDIDMSSLVKIFARRQRQLITMDSDKKSNANKNSPVQFSQQEFIIDRRKENAEDISDNICASRLSSESDCASDSREELSSCSTGRVWDGISDSIKDNDMNGYSSSDCEEGSFFQREESDWEVVSNITMTPENDRLHKPRKVTKLQCGLCGYSCSAVAVLRQHLSAVHRREVRVAAVVACPICSVTFTTTTNLRAHLLSHADERRYACDECDRSFIMKNRLVAHKRVVHQPKTFCCKECGKAFPTIHHLSRHERIHTGEKPYRCCFCAFASNTQGNLVKHVRSRHDRPDYTYKQHLLELGTVSQTIPDNELEQLQRKGAQVADKVLAKLDRPGLDIDKLKEQVQKNKQLQGAKKMSKRKQSAKKKNEFEAKQSKKNAVAAATSNKLSLCTFALVLPFQYDTMATLSRQDDDDVASQGGITPSIQNGQVTENGSDMQSPGDNMQDCQPTTGKDLGLEADAHVRNPSGKQEALFSYNLSNFILKQTSPDQSENDLKSIPSGTDQFYITHLESGKVVVLPLGKAVGSCESSAGDGFDILDASNVSRQAAGNFSRNEELNNENVIDIDLLPDRTGLRLSEDTNIELIASDQSLEESPESVSAPYDLATNSIGDDANFSANYELIQLPGGKFRLISNASESTLSSSDAIMSSNECISQNNDMNICSFDPAEKRFHIYNDDCYPVDEGPCDVTISRLTSQQLSMMTQMATDDDDDSDTETYIVNSKEDVDQLLSDVVTNIDEGARLASVGLLSSPAVFGTEATASSDTPPSPSLANSIVATRDDNCYTIHIGEPHHRRAVAEDVLGQEQSQPQEVSKSDDEEDESSFVVEFGDSDNSMCELLRHIPSAGEYEQSTRSSNKHCVPTFCTKVNSEEYGESPVLSNRDLVRVYSKGGVHENSFSCGEEEGCDGSDDLSPGDAKQSGVEQQADNVYVLLIDS